MSESPNESWKQNGGDLRAAADALGTAQRPGALLAVDRDAHALKKVRDDGLDREREGALLRRAWQTTLSILPASAVGRRTTWSRSEFVIEGTQATLCPIGTLLLAAFKDDNDLRRFEWHLVFTEIFIAEPERTFLCDPGYDLRASEGKSAIAWVRPYPGDDWKESRRYPTVDFVPLNAPSPSG